MRLYAVTDRSWLRGRTLYEQVEEALQGGVTFVQLREKTLSEEEFLEEAKKIKGLCKKYRVPFIINDKVEIAIACDADGVHVGQNDMKAENVREKLGPDKIIGVSARTVEQALLAQEQGADYIGSGACFATSTKQDANVIDHEELKRICKAVDIPVVAIVDPEMMSSMPKGLTAATGMDALTHAIEGYTTLGAWELADTLNLKAIELISRSLRQAVENEPQGREDMALGQYVTGMAFSNVGLGVVHGMAHPLSAFYDTPHGVANAVLLPYVMEFNAPYTGEKFREIARAMGVKGVDEMTPEQYRQAAIESVKRLSKDVGIPQTLKEIGVKREDLEALAEAAMADVCTGGNPRPCSRELVLEVYKTAFGE